MIPFSVLPALRQKSKISTFLDFTYTWTLSICLYVSALFHSTQHIETTNLSITGEINKEHGIYGQSDVAFSSTEKKMMSSVTLRRTL